MSKLPKAIGPYSVCRTAGNLIFTSGQIPIDPETNQVEAKTIQEQTKQVFANLKAVLETKGATLTDVVKTTVYLDNIADFAAFNEVYGEYFSEPYPGRTAIEVAALPMGVLVEIEAVAFKQ